MTIESTVSCGGCGATLGLHPNSVRDWLDGASDPCPNCSEPFDLWAQMVDAAKQHQIALVALGVAGASTTLGRVPLAAHGTTNVEFSSFGVPDSATVLRVLPTTVLDGRPDDAPDRHAFPFPMHQGALPDRHIGHRMSFIPWPSELDTDGVFIQLAITWIPEAADDARWPQLVEAFDAYTDGRFRDAVIPANVAVEATLRDLMRALMWRFASRDHVKNFMDNAATYGHQWNVLLPVFVGLIGSRELPADIRGNVNRLRSLRNDVGHGNSFPSVSEDEQAKLLVSAVIAVEYLRVISTDLDPPT